MANLRPPHWYADLPYGALPDHYVGTLDGFIEVRPTRGMVPVRITLERGRVTDVRDRESSRVWDGVSPFLYMTSTPEEQAEIEALARELGLEE